MNYLYGFASATVVYCGLSYVFPAEETLLAATIHDDRDITYGEGDAQSNEEQAYAVPLDDEKRSATIGTSMV